MIFQAPWRFPFTIVATVSKWSYLCHIHITLNINRLAFEGILYVLGQDLSQSYPALTLKSLCCIASASAIFSRGPMLTCVHCQRDLYIHFVFSWEWQTHKTHSGGFYWADQFPSIVTCGHWLFAYLLPLQRPSPVSPTSTKPIQKHFWKAWSGVLWCHDNSSNIIDFFPLQRPYHVLRISVARSPRRPHWLTQIRILVQRRSSVTHRRRTVMWNLIARFVKKKKKKKKKSCWKSWNTGMFETQINWW